jgi:ABC-type uncharacterized transport system auxiliary subunit
MSPPRHRSPAAVLVLLAALMLLATACGGGPPVYVHRYLLDYPPVVTAGPQPLAAALKVERFSSLPLVNTQKMLIANGPQEVSSYEYHRWQGYPADMVAGLLTRDLAASRRFRAVFGPDSSQMPRFRLDGGVVQFVQASEKGGQRAELRLELTLLDYHERSVLKQILFQKSYAQSVALAAPEAPALAAAMSQAMARISPQAVADVAAAVAARLASEQAQAAPSGK